MVKALCLLLFASMMVVQDWCHPLIASEEKPQVEAAEEKKAEESAVAEEKKEEGEESAKPSEEKPAEEAEKKEEPSEEKPEAEAAKEEEKEPVATETVKEAAEEKKAEEPAVADEPSEEEESAEIEGIDTVDVETPAGNWLLKRIWWEKAKDKFNKIRLAVNQIADAPMKFFMQQNELEKSTLDPFYREIGLEQGELQEVIKTLIDRINQERETEEGTLDFEERDVLQDLEEKQKDLEQLDKDVTAVTELDSKLDDALTLLLKQISQARTYENQAWEKFDAIAHELSDQKAQELFYSMNGLLKDIQKIGTYVQKEFADYFKKMVDAANEQIDRIKETIASLKEKGVDLKAQLEQLSEPSKEEPAEEKVPEEKRVPKQEQKGWCSSFWSWITGGS